MDEKKLGSEFYVDHTTVPTSVGLLIWGSMFVAILIAWGIGLLLIKSEIFPPWLTLILVLFVLLISISLLPPTGFLLYARHKEKQRDKERKVLASWKDIKDRFGWKLAKLNEEDLNRMWHFFYPNSDLVRLYKSNRMDDLAYEIREKTDEHQ